MKTSELELLLKKIFPQKPGTDIYLNGETEITLEEICQDLLPATLKMWPVIQLVFAQTFCPICKSSGKPSAQSGFSFYHPGSSGNFALCSANRVWNLWLE